MPIKHIARPEEKAAVMGYFASPWPIVSCTAQMSIGVFAHAFFLFASNLQTQSYSLLLPTRDHC